MFELLKLYCMLLHFSVFSQFNGWHRDAESLRAWAFDFLPSKVETVTWNKFRNDIMPSREPWIIDFFAPWCGHCQVFKPEFERVANVSMEKKLTYCKMLIFRGY